jgi:hypothetical protein
MVIGVVELVVVNRIMSFRDAEREGPRLTKHGTVAFV